MKWPERFPAWVWILLVFPCFILLPLQIAKGAVTSSTEGSSSAKRWVQFELENTEGNGVVPAGRSVDLSVVLGGIQPGGDPVVAMFDSSQFERQLVTLEPDTTPMVLRGSVTLEPHPIGRTSIHPKAARVQVTFGRFRNKRVERFMTRVVYVTVGKPEQEPESIAGSPPSDVLKDEDDRLQEEEQPDVEPLANAMIAEEDLLPFPNPGEGKVYWEEVSQIISRSWAHRARLSRRVPTSETVRVRFRMYANGAAQLIQIERGSGAREIDEAGIQAIVHAQPFPPFPTELGNDAIDVHVRMRTGARATVRSVQPTGRREASTTPFQP